MTHFVYPYKKPGNGVNQFDLMFSILGITKYFQGDYDITIIGEIPDYIDSNTVNFIPLEQTYTPNVNVTRAMIKACELFDRFIAIDDDMILLNDVTLSDFEILYHEDLYVMTEDGDVKDFSKGYGKIIKTSYNIVKNDVDRYYIFGVHVPVVYNSKMYMDMIIKYNILDLIERDIGITSVDMYRNVYREFLCQYFEMKYPNDFKISFAGYADPVAEEKLKSNSYDYKVLNLSEEGQQRHPFLFDFLKNKFNLED